MSDEYEYQKGDVERAFTNLMRVAKVSVTPPDQPLDYGAVQIVIAAFRGDGYPRFFGSSFAAVYDVARRVINARGVFTELKTRGFGQVLWLPECRKYLRTHSVDDLMGTAPLSAPLVNEILEALKTECLGSRYRFHIVQETLALHRAFKARVEAKWGLINVTIDGVPVAFEKAPNLCMSNFPIVAPADMSVRFPDYELRYYEELARSHRRRAELKSARAERDSVREACVKALAGRDTEIARLQRTNDVLRGDNVKLMAKANGAHANAVSQRDTAQAYVDAARDSIEALRKTLAERDEEITSLRRVNGILRDDNLRFEGVWRDLETHKKALAEETQKAVIAQRTAEEYKRELAYTQQIDQRIEALDVELKTLRAQKSPAGLDAILASNKSLAADLAKTAEEAESLGAKYQQLKVNSERQIKTLGEGMRRVCNERDSLNARCSTGEMKRLREALSSAEIARDRYCEIVRHSELRAEAVDRLTKDNEVLKRDVASYSAIVAASRKVVEASKGELLAVPLHNACTMLSIVLRGVS